ncbi:MAG: tRNA (adenosine(37)-N6)-threonylcarbamoyltransferase complex ATPase subunit type 1 TsaE [Candidatus Liptonbacteria bacterium]|nr:tRNA (adenosine(37)-N6)-threonylcarbamoyltransferase complex ATPase subunit type 1 TsaE [Candidatus Liptonbacteria bacterium]
MVYRSFSSEETKKFAESLARRLAAKKTAKHPLVIGLFGPLGSGKTTFVQGFFRGLGLRTRVMSPTFILFRRSALRDTRYRNVYHVDAYRLKNPRELLRLGFKEILSNPENIVLIEWADKIKKILPKRSLWLQLSHGRHEKERTIRI